MDDLPLNMFDFAVIGVVLVSAVIAFARGFVREILSVAAFIAAALAALWASPQVAPSVRDFVQPDWLAMLAVVVGIFLAVFIGVTMITHSLTSMLHRGDQVGFIDRVLGLGFGLARGVFFIALFVIMWTSAIAPSPDFMRDAYTCDLSVKTAQAIQSFADTSARLNATPVEDICAPSEG